MEVSPGVSPSIHFGYTSRGERGLLWKACVPPPLPSDDYYLATSNVSNYQLYKPDTYFYSLPSASGKFYLNPQTREVVLSGAINSIDTIFRKTTNSNTSGWIISDMNGIIYTFNSKDKGLTEPGDINTSAFYSSSTWNLSSIVLPWGKHVNFSYRDGVNSKTSIVEDFEPTSLSERISPYILKDSYPTNRNLSKYISAIETENEKIIFQLSSDRKDLQSSASDSLPKKLVAIHIYDKLNNKLIKTFRFNYDYFVSEHGSDDAEYNYKRLKLLSVQEVGYNNAIEDTIPRYSFEYNNTNLPVKNSKAVDHWGYYNGMNGNTTFLPDLSLYAYSGLIFGFDQYEEATQLMIVDKKVKRRNNLVNKANRGMNPDYAQANILREITYPTGGRRVINYEPNTFSNEVVFSADEEANGNGFYTDVNVCDYNYLPVMQCTTCQGTSGFLYPDTEGKVKIFDINVTLERYNPDISFQNMDGSYVKLIRVDASGVKQEIKVWDMTGKESEFNSTGKAIWKKVYFQYSGNKTDKYYFEASLVSNSKLPITPCGQYFPPKGVVTGNFKWINPAQKIDFSIGGGLRISSQESYTDNELKTSMISYGYNKEDNNSSGKLMSPLNYIAYRYYTRKEEQCFYMGDKQPPQGIINTYYENILSMSSNSYIPLSYDATGAVVGYDKVTVSETGKNNISGNGTVAYYYKNQPTRYVGTGFDIPGIPYLDNGFIDSVMYFNSSLKVLKKIKNEYQTKKDEVQYGVVIRDNYIGPDKCGLCDTETMKLVNPFIYQGRWIFIYYPVNSLMYVKSRVQEIEYFPETNGSLFSEKNMIYNQYGQLTRVTETLNEKNLIKEYEYSLTLGPSGMAHHNYINPVIHEAHYIDSKKVFDNYSTFKSFQEKNVDPFLFIKKNFFGSTIYVPYRDSIYLQTSNQRYYSNPAEKIQFNQVYDTANLQIIESYKKDDVRTSYFWGYNNQYPVAKIEGIANEDIPESARVELEKLDDNGIDLNLVNANIRQLLKNYRVTTFTYKPLIGIQTMTDPNGSTTYYDYDSLGRLKEIRDNERNILKNIEYNYHTNSN